MRLAVLMTVHNRKANTLRCLSGLSRQHLPEDVSLSVWMTDDGCTDGTPDAVMADFPDVHIVHGDGNLFWNRGMCVSWAAAAETGFDAYLWINDDVIPAPDMVLSLLSLSEEKSAQSIIVGATCSSNNHSIASYGGRVGKGKLVTPVVGVSEEVDFFNGNIVLVPSCVYGKIGGLDPYYTHSKGDYEYGYRAKENGVKIYQCDHFLGICDVHDSLAQWCNPDVPFPRRLKSLNSPLGMPPHETFHFEKRYFGLMTACFHYCTIILRCVFPRIWTFQSHGHIQ